MHTNTLVLPQRLPNTWRWIIALLIALTALFSLSTAAHADSTVPAIDCSTGPTARTVELWAKAGTLTLPDTTSVNVWGYALNEADAAQVPGPTLVACEGDAVEVILHNTLTDGMTSLALHGQGLAADRAGVGQGDTRTYAFTASRSGTFLYEAGMTLNGARQVGMGLYGALVVQPATPSAAYQSEAVVVLSEIDPALNADPTGFNMGEYKPRYWLINGQAYPNTGLIDVASGSTVLVRYVNAGLTENAMGLLGLDQEVIATDGYALPFSYRVVAESLPAGGTLDALVSIPAGVTDGTQYALYSTAQHLDNDGAANGGQLIYFNVAAPAPVPTDTPTPAPTDMPTALPTDTPTALPTDTPTALPTDTPTPVPTDTPTALPTDTPTALPTDTPIAIPTDTPTP